MATERRFFRASTGLNTVRDPVRIDYDWREGISDLAAAINVTISSSGRINRRKGKTLKVPLDSHSLFCDGGECVFVYDSGLYLLETNFSYRLLRSLSSNDRMAYTQVGDRIYFTNNQDLGYVENGIACTWAKTTDYVGPDHSQEIISPIMGVGSISQRGTSFGIRNMPPTHGTTWPGILFRSIRIFGWLSL